MLNPDDHRPQRHQPILNLPTVVVGCLCALLGIHFLRATFLSPDADFELLLTFAFIPARVMEPEAIGAAIPGGPAAALWSFVTYALFHADWTHVLFNSLWLAAFGAPLAWRFGGIRFLLFSAAGAIAGALFHFALHSGDIQPMIGASAAISAHMAGASRFVFSAGGPLRGFAGQADYRQPAAPLTEALGDRRVFAFLAVWFGLNLLFGLWGSESGLASGAIAWEAHIGGFLTGLLLFRSFDPVSRR